MKNGGIGMEGPGGEGNRDALRRTASLREGRVDRTPAHPGLRHRQS